MAKITNEKALELILTERAEVEYHLGTLQVKMSLWEKKDKELALRQDELEWEIVGFIDHQALRVNQKFLDELKSRGHNDERHYSLNEIILLSSIDLEDRTGIITSLGLGTIGGIPFDVIRSMSMSEEELKLYLPSCGFCSEKMAANEAATHYLAHIQKREWEK